MLLVAVMAGGWGRRGHVFDQRYILFLPFCNTLPGLTRLLHDPGLQHPLKKSNDLLELGIISDGLHFEEISVFVCSYK
jgi:hypothetical protein